MNNALGVLHERDEDRRKRYAELLTRLADGGELNAVEIDELDKTRHELGIALPVVTKDLQNLSVYFAARRQYVELTAQKAAIEAEKTAAERAYDEVNKQYPLGLDPKVTAAGARRDEARRKLRDCNAVEKKMIEARMACETLLAAGE